MWRKRCLHPGRKVALLSCLSLSIAWAAEPPKPGKAVASEAVESGSLKKPAKKNAKSEAKADSLTAKAAQASKAAQEAAAQAAAQEAERAATEAAGKLKAGTGKTGAKAGNKKPPAVAPATTVPSPPAAAAATVPPVPKEWSPEEIALASARCTAVLKDIDAVTTPEPAFRQGDCGAPAAVRLISVGRNPQVSFSPVPIVTCDMVGALHTWLKQDVQPLAKKHLGADIVKIETMSDYACRNAYGRTKGKLSEHGHANALDIRGFVTAKAVPAYVLENWGPIQREIAAQEAAKVAAKVAAEKVLQEQAAAAAAASAQSASSSQKPSGTRGTIVEGVPQTSGSKGSSSLGFQPSRLGGPKDKDVKAKGGADKEKDKSKARGAKPDTARGGSAKQSPAGASPPVAPAIVKGATPGNGVAVFLHEVHAAACRTFGTTLGPEANNDHRNHFHIDMAPRKFKKICD